jgi:hypothetical protein
MFHPSRPRMMCPPSRQLDQGLVLFRLLALKTIHPRQPPIPALTLFIAAYIALITLAIRHSISPCRSNYHISTALQQIASSRPSSKNLFLKLSANPNNRHLDRSNGQLHRPLRSGENRFSTSIFNSTNALASLGIEPFSFRLLPSI